MSSNSGSVSVVPIHPASTKKSDAPKPGYGAKFDDGTWEVTGDGHMTETQAMGGIIHSEAQQGNPEMQSVDNLPEADKEQFARQAAQQQWPGDNPDEPIPAGTTKSVSLKDLVNMIAPFMDAYRQQQLALQSGTSTPGSSPLGSYSRTIGQVPSQGFELPID